MKFSIIVPTFQRTQPLYRLLDSLSEQHCSDLEVIIVDQNDDARLDPIVKRYQDRLHMTHVHSAIGLSRARNVGISIAQHEVVCFADDDCWYPQGLLEKLSALFRCKDIDGVSFPARDGDGTPVARFDKRSGPVTRYNVWTRCCGVTLCVRTEVARSVKGFDEQLGLGAGTPFGAGEDTDFPLQIIANGGRIFYDHELYVFHPHPGDRTIPEQMARATSYGPGMGYVLKKHKYPLWFCLYHLARPLGGCILSLAMGRTGLARVKWTLFRSRLWGWRQCPRKGASF